MVRYGSTKIADMTDGAIILSLIARSIYLVIPHAQLP